MVLFNFPYTKEDAISYKMTLYFGACFIRDARLTKQANADLSEFFSILFFSSAFLDIKRPLATGNR